MTAEEILHAKFSNAAYDEDPGSIEGFIPMAKNPFGEFSFEYVVWERAGHVVLAFRGTASARDRLVDAGDIVLRGQSPLAMLWTDLCYTGRQSRDVLRKVMDHFPGHQYSVTGHSLGGFLAAHAIAGNDSPAISCVHIFNAGAGLLGDTVFNDSRINSHHVIGDWISTTSGLRKKVYECKSSNSHSIENFLP
jgi:hypothetical protein